MTSETPPSIREAFDFAWGMFKSHFGQFTAYILTFLGAWVILEVLVIAGQGFGFIWWLVAHSGFFIVFAGLEVGFIRVCLDLYDNKQVTYTDIFHELNLGAKFFLVQLVYFAMVLIGLLLVIVPGAYLGTRFTFYPFTFVEGNPNLQYSLQQSAMTSRSSMRFLFWFSVLIIIFNLIGASILGIGLIVTVSLSVLMRAHVYRQLKG